MKQHFCAPCNAPFDSGKDAAHCPKCGGLGLPTSPIRTEESTVPLSDEAVEAEKRTFKKGEFVLFDSSGKLVQLKEDAWAGGVRHIRFIRSKTLCDSGFPDSGCCIGGIWKDGYPKSPIAPDDVLFAAAATLHAKVYRLDRQLKGMRHDVAALERARELLSNDSPAACTKDV